MNNDDAVDNNYDALDNDDAMDVETRVNANGMVMTMTMMPLLSTRRLDSVNALCQTHPKPRP
jgi:hypothetical protein